MDNPKLTPRERDTLAALRRVKRKNPEPTMADIAKEAGLSKPGVQGHLEKLRLKGRILGPVKVGTWELTELGEADLARPKKDSQSA